MIFRAFVFCLNYCAALVCTFLILLFLETVPGLSAGYYALLVLPLFVVSVIEGQAYARHSGARPKNCQACFGALQMAVLALLLGKGIVLAASTWAPGGWTTLGLPPVGADWTLFAISVGAGAVVLRTGYAYGLASGLRNLRFKNGAPGIADIG